MLLQVTCRALCSTARSVGADNGKKRPHSSCGLVNASVQNCRPVIADKLPQGPLRQWYGCVPRVRPHDRTVCRRWEGGRPRARATENDNDAGRGARRAWAAIAGPLKIIDCLLEPKLLGIACRALSKHRHGGGDVIGCPVMSGAGRRVWSSARSLTIEQIIRAWP
jgi:hypothetical protein